MTVPTFSWRHTAAPGGNLQLLPESTVDGVTIRILDFADPLDLGLIEWASFEAPQVGQDGMAYFGGVFSAGREMTIPLWCQCGSLAKALDTQRDLQRWFHNHAFGFLRVARVDSSSESIVCEAKCYTMNRKAFFQAHAEAAAGIVGNAQNGNLLYVVKLCAPYPHFRDGRSAPEVDASGQYPTDDVVILTNNCPNEIGVYATLVKAGGTITAARITNETTGRYIEITDTMAEQITIDWFKTDPDRFAVSRGSTSIIGSLNIGAKLTLVPGNNVLRFSGSGSGPTFDWEIYFTEDWDSI